MGTAGESTSVAGFGRIRTALDTCQSYQHETRAANQRLAWVVDADATGSSTRQHRVGLEKLFACFSPESFAKAVSEVNHRLCFQ